MSLFQATEPPALIEPVHVPDVFCSGIARIEKLGSNFRFVLFVEREHDGLNEHVIVGNIVFPIDAVPNAIQQTLIALAGATKVLNFPRR